MPTIKELVRIYLENLIYETRGNLSRMAEVSGLGRATLYRKLYEMDLWPQVERVRLDTAPNKQKQAATTQKSSTLGLPTGQTESAAKGL
jgi:hypothetical protein